MTDISIDRETVGSHPNLHSGVLTCTRFAVRAVEQAQTYWNLVEKISPKTLRLTKHDEEIFEHTLKAFPELSEDEHAKLIKIDEDWMKSEDGKRRWREFCEW